MIRTYSIALESVKGFAYRQKLSAGDVSIVVYADPKKQPGIASISKKTGEPIVAANTPKFFSKEIFAEAIALTNGMPYHKLGKPRIVEEVDNKSISVVEDESLNEDVIVLDTKEYEKVVEKYTDRTGKLNYELLNKDLIKSAYNSKYINEMIAERASVDEIRATIVRMKIKDITGDTNLTDTQINKMVELLDEAYEKSVLRALNEEIRKWLGAAKK